VICKAIQPDVALLVFLEGEFKSSAPFGMGVAELQAHLFPQTKVEWRKGPSA
jgi:hypothetical protein